MLFSLKSVIISSLAASALATPYFGAEKSGLSRRATSGDYVCPDGSIVTKAAVGTAFQAVKDDATVGGYPAVFQNTNVIADVASTVRLWVFPVNQNSTAAYSGGSPGPYRVVIDGSYNFHGVVQYTGGSNGVVYSACDASAGTVRRSDDDKKEDKEDKKEDKHSAAARTAGSMLLLPGLLALSLIVPQL
ncbi:hypothetical protein BX600DRAFT_513902 [Xylariales sp. PMI_506]|nr:hypothetical protein BX600DRAFT_513902 [Xylariales sp. PMI_506]